ncbi:hypothetical protein ACOZ4L_10380 [Haloplanus ruber]|uniref:DUF11 domain-containing protein n=1 Tax=Haloplanus ruber TaxID=869892 RepID=A0ABD6CYU5_9EURY|nr:hypothetical protein [Haloplanus ruber]
MSGERRPSSPAGTGGESTHAESDADADNSGALGSWGRMELVFAALLVVAVAGTAALILAPPNDTTAADADSGATGPAAATPTHTPTAAPAAATSPNVTMRVRSVENCGSRCRTVTIALSNEGAEAARDVRVATSITTGDSLVWEASSDVGRIATEETATRTRTVRIGYADAAKIKANDGRIRIETVVRTANATRTFTEERTVV